MNSNYNSLIINSRYEIIKKIGKGTMGKVFLVHDLKLDKLWAAKLIYNPPGNELTALKTISHNAFPRIVDTVNSFDGYFLIMDYFWGQNLDRYLSNKNISLSLFFKLSLDLADALSYLHNLCEPMLYLDCKPSNIVIEKNEVLRLVDLGSSYLYLNANPGKLTGSMGYASPEQLSREEVDVRSDIYSYGMTLKYIFSHVKPVSRFTSKKILNIIEKCTRLNKDERYSSLFEVSKQIKRMSRKRHSFKLN